ncbi:MAG: 2-oxo acid dehydrogenase subunit E2 [Prolixibacteraceae bacterium]|jgi:pyruvate dehydrogenase E2 component (dihydrolipoamide acetyltransferase)|nr:2-oxo acid dehydrogenase subunit E2 [Prolixibacteraceae bacterium]
MATIVIMPKQGQSVESCILTEIPKKIGDKVSKGELLFAYETDKASFEEFAPVDGTILAFHYESGDEVPVLKEVCIIGDAGETVASAPSAVVPEVKVVSETVAIKEEKPEVTTKTIESATAEGSFISPRARSLAAKEGIDTTGIKGSGPNGRILEQDLLVYLATKPKITPLAKMKAEEEQLCTNCTGSGLGGAITAKDLKQSDAVASDEFEIKKLSNIRKLIAKAMLSSLQNSAQLTHHLSADARQISHLRKVVKKAVGEGYPTNITLNDMICFAVIKALKKYPQVNTHFMDDSIKYFKKVHLGIAVDTDRGLMVPVIRNADDLSIQGLSNQLKTVAAACKNGSINPDLLASEAATFTVSNLGNYGVEMFTPVINLPQTAILGVNTIVPRPKDLGDGVYGFVPHLGLSLTYNHQALDGGEATRFLKQIATEIENLTIEL